MSLGYESRYAEADETRSVLDADANAEANAAQKPLDDFIRNLTSMANRVAAEADPKPAAECVVAQIAQWARAGALAKLETETAKLTFGSRMAGLAMALWQAKPYGGRAADWAAIDPWLRRLAREQMTFWEEDAPPGAKRGNLRAWAALGLAASADVLADPVLRSWATWSAHYVICTANPDGSLPQEMSRGRLALHYQLHAVAPLVVTARLLRDHNITLHSSCNSALENIVTFTLSDICTGAATEALTGERQSFFDGTRDISGYHLAWLSAWHALSPTREVADLMKEFAPLSSSKLGGDQSLIWHHPKSSAGDP